MTVTTKPEVRFRVITPALLRMLEALVEWPDVDRPRELVVTSGSDGRHMVGSKHYTGEALDVRSQSFPSQAAKQRFRAALEAQLGPKFRVLLEQVGATSEHFHCQVRQGCRYP